MSPHFPKAEYYLNDLSHSQPLTPELPSLHGLCRNVDPDFKRRECIIACPVADVIG